MCLETSSKHYVAVYPNTSVQGMNLKKKNRNPLELQELKGAFEEKLTFQALLHVKKDFQEVQCLLRNEEVVLQGEIKEPKFPVDADLRDKVPA